MYLNMSHVDHLVNKHPGIEREIAEKIHGPHSLSPEELMLLKEEVELTERAVFDVSQIEKN